jgi:hypothetical protein
LRHPFSLQKITWNESTKTVIYRSKRHHTIKRNFEIFKAPDFIAAALLHLPPKGQQTVRYYGVYSNKTRGLTSPIPDHIIRPPTPSPNQQSAIKEWIPDDEPALDWFNRPRNPSNPDPDGLDQKPAWKPEEIQLEDGRTLVLK